MRPTPLKPLLSASQQNQVRKSLLGVAAITCALASIGLSAATAQAGTATPTQITAGRNHNCALLSNGTVSCWGANRVGALGDGTDKTRTVRLPVTGITGATQVAAGAEFTCALISGGTIKCWGDNYFGSLGDGTNTTSYTPKSVTGIKNAIKIAAGAYHACALLSDRTVNCWGYGSAGQLGNGSNDLYSNSPVAVSGITTATDIAGGSNHTCAVVEGGLVQCWGSNVNGQLGDDTTNDSNTPQTAAALHSATQVASSSVHTCAIDHAVVFCWGYNSFGQLGNGDNTNSSSPGYSNVFDAIQIAAGGYHSCAVTTGGSVNCWGSNSSGQLGDGTYDATNTSTTVSGITSATQVATGDSHSCALLAEGTIKCWGTNRSGELGDGTLKQSSVPVDLAKPPFPSLTVLTPAAGTATVYKSGSKWAIKIGLLFSNDGDTRGAAQLLTLQVAVDKNGRPVSKQPSDSAPAPTSATYEDGIVGWPQAVNGEMLRQSVAQPVWVRAGNRAGKWTGWVKLTA